VSGGIFRGIDGEIPCTYAQGYTAFEPQEFLCGYLDAIGLGFLASEFTSPAF
jgi:hypothetical protein